MPCSSTWRGGPTETVRTYATRLRHDGYMVKRVQERGIRGYKLVANAPVMQMAAE
jgi:biotin operon repressor